MGPQNQQLDRGCDDGSDVSLAGATEFNEEKARKGARLLLEAVGRDPGERGVSDTWMRRVPAMLETLTEGRRPEEKPTMRTFETETDGLVVKTGIPLYSLCEHHLLPFYGVAHVAYRPEESMVGLSKLARYVRWRSRRLTTQEALTSDIATGLADEIDASGVAVEVTATHMCEAMRGVEMSTSTTTRETVGELSTIDHEQFRESVRRADVANDHL